ncbi:hypothetical protein L3X38_039354 [Prunus dulcis]|uniref:Uncharacterized protein n=1 Tax=Prunus dulcis TaxID=3755 RepID=A0AAD4V886_PRUDU|nr:hypothetical protein L3X38_039354 [Prunus dulcis]
MPSKVSGTCSPLSMASLTVSLRGVFGDSDGPSGGIDQLNGWEVEVGGVVDLVGWRALLADDQSKAMMIIHGGWMDAGQGRQRLRRRRMLLLGGFFFFLFLSKFGYIYS